MPAHSQHQQSAAGIALAAKRGKIPRSKLKGPALRMLSMSEGQLHEFATTPRKALPAKAKGGKKK